MYAIHIEKVNEVYVRVKTEPAILSEISDQFSFRPEGYQFMPAYKNKMWDGYVRIFNIHNKLLYAGLVGYLKEYAITNGYKFTMDKDIAATDYNVDEDFPDLFFEKLKVPGNLKLRDYQREYIRYCINQNRALIQSPTSSGKSLIIYLTSSFHARMHDRKVLIIVPTIGLVSQMAGDFIDYGCNPKRIHRITAGVDKNTDANFVISTWQSIFKMPKSWFAQFDVVVGDEAHLFQAKSLTSIMEKLVDCKFRYGFTGTISSQSKIHKLVLEGLFGSHLKLVSTKQLIDDGTVATFKIKAIVLNHSAEDKGAYKKLLAKAGTRNKFHTEREFLAANENRMKFLKNLLGSLEGQNNLILFDLVEKQGEEMFKIFKRPGRELHIIHGKISGQERERIRALVENDPVKRHDILASYQTFATGTNLKKLDNVIFSSGSKSETRVLQSIGRVLRKGNGSDDACLYDIGDMLGSVSKPNYSFNHFSERLNIYKNEGFKFKIYNVDL